jgi:hypothetical protein
LIPKTIYAAAIFLFSFTGIFAQGYISAGASVGGGFIGSNSPNQSSFASTLFLESGPFFIEDFGLRFSFHYAGDYNQLVPGDRSRYNPFIKGFSLKAVYSQIMSPPYFIEEGLGILILNDRTFIDRDAWGQGILFSLLAGVDFRNFSEQGLKIGASGEYGLTFVNAVVRYFTLNLQANYFF